MKVRTLVSTAILATAALAGASSSQAQSHRPLRGTTVAAADRVPTFDTRPSCADAASDISATRTTTSCQQSEQQARDTLMSRWQSFPAADKRNCVAGTDVGGFPSYVQVLVCLELARDARAIKTN